MTSPKPSKTKRANGLTAREKRIAREAYGFGYGHARSGFIRFDDVELFDECAKAAKKGGK